MPDFDEMLHDQLQAKLSKETETIDTKVFKYTSSTNNQNVIHLYRTSMKTLMLITICKMVEKVL